MKRYFFILSVLTSLITSAALPVTVGEEGLWKLRFRNGKALTESACAGRRDVTVEKRKTDAGEVTVWRAPEATVKVTRTERGDATDWVAEITAISNDVTGFDMPARLRFGPDDVKRLVMPQYCQFGPGVAFNAKFFKPQTKPTSWKEESVGQSGYTNLFGRAPTLRPWNDPAVPLSVTQAGKEWFGGEAAAFASKQVLANRCARPGTLDTVLLDSPNGPWLGGRRIGKGAVWRFGGSLERSKPLGGRILTALVRGIVARRAPGRRIISILDLSGAPDYHKPDGHIRSLYHLAGPGIVFERLTSIAEFEAALAAPDRILVCNPYGECIPMEDRSHYAETVARIRAYANAGGNWVGTGGLDFHNILVPQRYNVYEYDPLFMDYCHLTATGGERLALYGVQPRPPHEPWKNPCPYLKGGVACGADAKGGWIRHTYRPFVRSGSTRRLPPVRILRGVENPAAIVRYGEDNSFTRTLADKLSPAKLDTFRKSMFLLYGSARAAEMTRIVPELPKPTLFHITSFLQGGWDRQYPDLLPPHPQHCGTAAELRALIDALHAHGHLFCPYTNPTWWGDNPPGPTLRRVGTAAASIRTDGEIQREEYAPGNTGFCVSQWHPEVRAATRRTLEGFTKDFPCDLLFQDQCGNRVATFDFNPAAPAPDAYTEGLLSMLEEGAAAVPLGTEDAWDRAADIETALFGACWRLVSVPTEGDFHARKFRHIYDPDTWELDPCALYLMHHRALFWMHDLGQFVTERRILAWMFALGYNLSYRMTGDSWANDKSGRAWFGWLADLQRHVVSRIAGERLASYEHRQGAEGELDEGTVVARYGEITVKANLCDKARTVAGERLAPYGWSVSGPGVRAAALEGQPAFFETPELRREEPGRDDAGSCDCRTGIGKGAVALLNLRPALDCAWTRVSAAAWSKPLAELAASRNRPFREISSVTEFRAILDKSPDEIAMIVNPYGERFPVPDANAWPETSASLRAYIARGGWWVETAGYPFTSCDWLENGNWKRRHLWGAGANAMGIHVGQGGDSVNPTRLYAADGSPLACREAMVNRPLIGMPTDGVVARICDERGRIWFGYYSRGKGRLYRVGGGYPPFEAVLGAISNEFQTQRSDSPPAP